MIVCVGGVFVLELHKNRHGSTYDAYACTAHCAQYNKLAGRCVRFYHIDRMVHQWSVLFD